MRPDTFLLSVVVPMYYEQEVARECHRRLSAVLAGYEYELIFVNDGSLDDTPQILNDIARQDARSRIIHFSRNFGHQAAVTAGIEAARGHAVVIIDADLQDPPEIIPQMVALWQQDYDVVYAKRARRQGETAFKKITATIFYRVLRKLTETDIPQDTGDFRLIDRKVADAFLNMPERNRFIRGMVAWLGFRQIPLEYVREERYAGTTKYPLKKMLRFAANGILSFSTQPLRLVLSLGFVVVLISLALLVWAVIARLTSMQTTPGWASLMVVITFLGGIQLISIGVLGQYIARIFEQSQARPLYIIRDRVNFDK